MMTEPQAQAKRAPRSWMRLAPLLALALILAVVLATGAGRHLSFENVLASRQKLDALIAGRLPLALGGYMLLYAAVVAASIPGATLFTVAGGLLFGGWIGGFAAMIGATTGATLLFLAARTSLGHALAQRAGPRMARLREGFQKDAVSYLLFLRLVSVFPFWLVNLALAATGVRLATFVWTTFLGIMPATLAFSLAGAGLGSIADAKRSGYDACVAAAGPDCSISIGAGDLVTRETLLAITALGVMALIPVLLRRRRRADPLASARSTDV